MIKKTYFSVAVLLASFVYLPFFITPFLFHNDGYLIETARNNWFGFPEAEHIFLRGRALGAILVSVQGWLTNRISDLTVSRVILFLMLVAAAYLLKRFLERRCALESHWAALSAFLFLLLPSNILNVLWVANAPCGPLNILLAFGAYFLLDRAWRGTNVRDIISSRSTALLGAGLLFIAALFIYQPTALVVFVFPFAYLLFSTEKIGTKRNVFLRDIVFFSIAVLIYRLIDQWIFLPWGQKNFPASTALAGQGFYDPALGLNAAEKINLIGETFFHAFGGLVPITAGALLIVALSMKKNPAGISLPTAGLLLICFLMGNLPTLIAKGCTHVLGFRVLLPAAVMAAFFFVWLLRRLGQTQQKIIVPFVILIIIVTAGLSALSVRDIAANHEKPHRFIETKIRQADLKDTEAIVIAFNTLSDTFIDHPLPFEFAYSMTTSQHVLPIIEEVLRPQGIAVPDITAVNENSVLYRTPFTFIIDLEEIRGKHLAAAPRRKTASIRATEKIPRPVIINAGNPIWTFKERAGAQLRPHWEVPRGDDYAVLNVDYENIEAELSGYSLSAANFGPSGTIMPAAWVVQGSNDRQNWKVLDIRQGTTDVIRAIQTGYQFTERGFFKHYRFIWKKNSLDDILRIYAVRVIPSGYR